MKTLLSFLVLLPLTIYGQIMMPGADAFLGALSQPAGGGGDLYSNGFEEGNFTGWDGGETDASGLLSVQGTTKRTGSYAAQLDITASTTAICTETLAQNYPDGAYITFYIRFNDITALDTANGGIRTVSLNDSAGVTQCIYGLYCSNTPWDLNGVFARYNADSGLVTGTVFGISPTVDTWHKCTMYWKPDTDGGADTANVGICKLWFDGTLEVNLTNLDTDTRNGVGQLRVGFTFTDWNIANGTVVYFDDVVVNAGDPAAP